MAENQTTVRWPMRDPKGGRIEKLAAAMRELPPDDPSADALIEAMARHGLVLSYIEDIQNLGEMGNVCTWSRTGRVCPYCSCDGRNVGDASVWH